MSNIEDVNRLTSVGPDFMTVVQALGEDDLSDADKRAFVFDEKKQILSSIRKMFETYGRGELVVLPFMTSPSQIFNVHGKNIEMHAVTRGIVDETNDVLIAAYITMEMLSGGYKYFAPYYLQVNSWAGARESLSGERFMHTTPGRKIRYAMGKA